MIIEDFTHSSDAANVARRANLASLDLAATKSTDRAAALQAMAQALKRRQNDILEANTLDLEASRDMAIPELIVDWLKLTPERIKTTVQILQRLGEMPDPIGQGDQCFLSGRSVSGLLSVAAAGGDRSNLRGVSRVGGDRSRFVSQKC